MRVLPDHFTGARSDSESHTAVGHNKWHRFHLPPQHTTIGLHNCRVLLKHNDIMGDKLHNDMRVPAHPCKNSSESSTAVAMDRNMWYCFCIIGSTSKQYSKPASARRGSELAGGTETSRNN